MPIFPLLRRQGLTATRAQPRHAEFDVGQVEHNVYETIYGTRTGAVDRIQPAESPPPDVPRDRQRAAA